MSTGKDDLYSGVCSRCGEQVIVTPENPDILQHEDSETEADHLVEQNQEVKS